MTASPSRETLHVTNSLLVELAKHTTIDIDNNVASIAVQHNLAHRRMLELGQTTGQDGAAVKKQVLDEFRSLFNDMTSNQIIVSSTYTSLLETEPEKAHKLLQTCISAAKQLQAGTWNGATLDEAMLARLSIDASGLNGNETAEEIFQQLASDILTVFFGLEMLPNLLSAGCLHAQTLPSQAYNLAATMKHARRFVAFYE